MSTFAITSTTKTADLDAKGKASVSFTVTNMSGKNVPHARASVKSDNGAKPDWFEILPPEEREIAVEGTHVFTVAIDTRPPKPKMPAPAGSYKFQLLVVDPTNTDELGNTSDWIPFTVIEQKPPRPFPWLWVILAVAVLLVAAGGGATWYFVWGPGHKPAPKPTPPVLVANVQITQHGITNFGTVQVHNSSPASLFQLHNSGNKDANVTVTLAGPDAVDFKMAEDTCTGVVLLVNHDCEIQIAFAPGTQGSKSAHVTFTVDSGNVPSDINFSGTAQGVSQLCFDPQPPLTLTIYYNPLIYAAYGIPIPSSTSSNLVIKNCGTGNLTMQAAALSGDVYRFTISSNLCTQTLIPGATCNITVQLRNATSDGTWTATLTLTDDAANSPQSIQVIGVKKAQQMSIKK